MERGQDRDTTGTARFLERLPTVDRTMTRRFRNRPVTELERLTRQDRTRQEKKEKKREKDSPPNPLSLGLVRKALLIRVAFYAAYPLHEAPDEALKAWRQVTSAGADPPEIMAGLARYSFRPDPKFIKHPASWLRADAAEKLKRLD